MYIIKIDLPTGTAYFTGKKRVTQGCESPGLADTEEGACTYETAKEATRMCKMLFRKFDMEFYYTEEGAQDKQPEAYEESEEAAEGTDAGAALENGETAEAGASAEDGEASDAGDAEPDASKGQKKSGKKKKKK